MSDYQFIGDLHRPRCGASFQTITSNNLKLHWVCRNYDGHYPLTSHETRDGVPFTTDDTRTWRA